MTKNKPSNEYIENLRYYKKMHIDGYNLIDGRKREPNNAYDGKSTIIFAPLVKNIIKQNNIKSMLDYGCGKGFYYENAVNISGINNKNLREFWDINIDIYDPCYEKHDYLDEKKSYDLVICIDVLEHIPAIDIDWVLDNIFNKSKKYVFINVACYPAIALLPNGKNAHININSPKWWHKKIFSLKQKYQSLKIICVCSLKEKGELKYLPLQYNDRLTNYT